MKSILMPAAVFLFFVCGTTHVTSAETGAEQPSATGAAVREYEIYGMDCPGCHEGVEKLVEKIASVEKAQAHWKAKTLTVFLRPGEALDEAEIQDAVERANLTLGKRVQ